MKTLESTSKVKGKGRGRAEAAHAEVKLMAPAERLAVIKSLLATGLERMIAKSQSDCTTEEVER